jgi:hypothetical protein
MARLSDHVLSVQLSYWKYWRKRLLQKYYANHARYLWHAGFFIGGHPQVSTADHWRYRVLAAFSDLPFSGF